MRHRLLPVLAAALLFAAGCSSSTEPDKDNSSAQRVGNAQTKVFHTTNCRYVPDIQQKENFKDRDEAIASGYRPDESNACDP